MTTAYTEKDYKSRRFNMRALFDSFAEGAVRDFPQLKNKFALYSAPTNSWHTDLATQNNCRVKQHLKEAIKKKDLYTAFAWQLDDLYLMSWVTDPGLKYIDLSYTFFVLQHELGHLGVPAAARTTGNHESNFRECAADIFSLTRIEQMYHGINADTKRQKMKERDTQTTKATPQQAFLRKVDHLQVLGYFDREKDQNNIIDSRDYESAENQAYIKAGRENYIKRHRPGRAAKIMSFLRVKRG